MNRVRTWLDKVTDFLTADVWQLPTDRMPRGKSLLVRQLRIIILSFRGFVEDKCILRASSLTFYSLLSIVPVAAVVFAIAKGFGFERLLERQLVEKLPGQEEVVSRIVGFSHALLESTKGGVLAGLGVVLLLWTVLKVLGHIEMSFNEIWGVREARSLGRKFSDYLAILFISPILVILSGSASVFIITQVKTITEKISLLGSISPLIFAALKLVPYGLIWVLLTFLYMMMPNTKVRFSSGLIGGIVAGTAYVVVQWIYINFQIGTAKYNAIYGSFAALPLFLVWLQASWLIILFGGEISFAHQNVDTYEFEPEGLRISPSFKRLLSLQIVHLIVGGFARGERPLTAEEIARRLELPIRLTRLIIHELVEAGIVSPVRTGQEKEFACQPARDIAAISVQSVITALDRIGSDDIPFAGSDERDRLSALLGEFEALLAASPDNRLLRDI